MTLRDAWSGQDAEPVVRPYAVTGGRTTPQGGVLDLMALVVAVGGVAELDGLDQLGPEHRAIATLCHEPTTVVDVASATGLPLGVVRVLLSDLIQAERMTVRVPEANQRSARLLREVLDGLRAL